MNPVPNRMMPMQARPQLPDPNVGAAPMGGGFDQRLQMMQGRNPGFAYDPGLKWGPQVAAAMHARNAARRAAMPQQQASPMVPNPSGSPLPQQPNPFRPHGRPY
jgi:hypothetical protein